MIHFTPVKDPLSAGMKEMRSVGCTPDREWDHFYSDSSPGVDCISPVFCEDSSTAHDGIPLPHRAGFDLQFDRSAGPQEEEQTNPGLDGSL